MYRLNQRGLSQRKEWRYAESCWATIQFQKVCFLVLPVMAYFLMKECKYHLVQPPCLCRKFWLSFHRYCMFLFWRNTHHEVWGVQCFSFSKLIFKIRPGIWAHSRLFVFNWIMNPKGGKTKCELRIILKIINGNTIISVIDETGRNRAGADPQWWTSTPLCPESLMTGLSGHRKIRQHES